MENKDREEIGRIANEELDKRVKPKKVRTYGDPVVQFKD
jgi:hypothetical protein